MSVGAELAHARQQGGLSLDDLSSRTKIKVERLAAIEQMDGEHLPNPLYLKGFLRAYATEVGLDPDDVVARYMREVEPAAPVVYQPQPQALAKRKPETETADAVVDPPAPASSIRLGPLVLVPVIALVIGMLAAANMERLPWGSDAPAVVTPPQEETGTPQQEGAPTADKRDDAATQKEAAAEQAERASSAAVPDAPAAKARADEAPPNVNGVWTLTNRIESATYGAYKNLALGFRVQLQQNGDRITGSGVKVSENGNAIAAGRRTPISVEGTIEGRQLNLRFTERGAQRSSTGSITLELADDGTLRGTFKSDAANARGTSVGQRAR